MKRQKISYFFQEGIRGLFSHGFMSFAAISVIVVCLLIMGSFSLFSYNLSHIIADIQNTNEILVYIDKTLSDAQAESVGTYINLNDNVQQAIFISRQEALDSFKSDMQLEGEDLLAGLDQDNPLRNRFRVLLRDASKISDTRRQLMQIAGVASVNDREDLVNKLSDLRQVVVSVCYILILALVSVSLFIISNTVKLATFVRREEIAIMRVVGATKGFVRIPFVIEGFFLGLLGAVVAYFLQSLVYNTATEKLIQAFTDIMPIQFIRFQEMWTPVFLVFLLTGIAVGVGGSVITIRKFLKT